MEITLQFSSTAFKNGANIPVKYTGEGDDILSPLSWSDPPDGTRSFAIIFEDPEDTTAPGGVFTHWFIFNIPPDSREMPESLPKQSKLTNKAIQGKNDFGKIGYGGPLPDGTGPHRYRFTLYALNHLLDLAGDVSKVQVLDSTKRHVLAKEELWGIYPHI